MRTYPDGRLELAGSPDDHPPRDGGPRPALPATVWARRDDGPWALVPGATSVYGALTSIQGLATAAEAFAKLCHPEPCP